MIIFVFLSFCHSFNQVKRPKSTFSYRCETRQQSHRKCHEDICQRLSGLEAKLSECAAEQVTSYVKCLSQQKRAKVSLQPYFAGDLQTFVHLHICWIYLNLECYTHIHFFGSHIHDVDGDGDWLVSWSIRHFDPG